ncbi:Coproporphyrinogen III oxidase [Paraphysoderma sedebokerense]|nr:Coproporphyrinogen III oxidase [Paraphysoderma sedebokerense]
MASRVPIIPRLLNRLPRPLNLRLIPNHRCFSTSPNSTSAYSSRRQFKVAAVLLTGISAIGAASYFSRENVVKRNDLSTAAYCEGRKTTKSNKATSSSSDIDLADTKVPMRDRMAHFVHQLQNEITSKISEIDGTPFHVDSWTRPQGGTGVSCVLQGGKVFEKAGVNVSVVHGDLPPSAVQQMRARGRDFKGLEEHGSVPFFAAGISIVVHPWNPMVPTVHLNYRYFEVQNPENPDEAVTWWFGGGSDLTPSFVFEEDAVHFHQTLKTACDKHDHSYYPRFKKWCDDYFYIPHRQECRGVGGIFFDDLDDRSPEEIFKFAQDCGKAFLPSYVPIILKRKDLPYTEDQKIWQQIRRGRYVEFNLVYDRGTKFGLATPGARIESILMSLPLTARWEYQQKPKIGSWEERSLEVLKKPRDWV